MMENVFVQLSIPAHYCSPLLWHQGIAITAKKWENYTLLSSYHYGLLQKKLHFCTQSQGKGFTFLKTHIMVKPE